MPISREEFKSGQIDLEGRILALMEKDLSKAWMLAEILQELRVALGMAIPDEHLILGSLFLLETAGRIEYAKVDEEEFWIAKQR